MLSGERNEIGEKTTMGHWLAKKATLYVQHTFFEHLFAVVMHYYNMKLSETSTFYGRRKCRTCSCSLSFLLALIFTLVAASISHFLTSATKFSCCSSNRKCLLCYFSLALAHCRSFSRWASLACRLLSLSLYYKSNLWTWQLIKA